MPRYRQPPKPVMLPKVLGQLCSQSSGAEAHELAQLREANQRLTERLAAIELQQAVREQALAQAAREVDERALLPDGQARAERDDDAARDADERARR